TEQFADRLIRLLTDDALRERMGQAGYERVQAHFSLAGQVKQMVAIYEAVMETSKR
ncbi:MAG: glycosyltransferase family 1 protein, partial [Chloroflexi bacterium]